MIVTCPACAARYLVDQSALGTGGRTVRCANCAETWHQEAPATAPKAIEFAEPPPVQAPSYPGESRNLPVVVRRRGASAAAVVWLILLLILVGAIGSALFARNQIVALWPPAARLYGLAGIVTEPGSAGLTIVKKSANLGNENGKAVWVIDGEVVNTSKLVRDVPPLVAILRDRSARPLLQMNFSSSSQRLLPGESASFHATIPNPPTDTTDIAVDFSGQS